MYLEESNIQRNARSKPHYQIRDNDLDAKDASQAHPSTTYEQRHIFQE
jgi:hypothetical protein